MFEVGRLCIKLAGRDAGQKCVVVDVLEGKYVLVDGMTRRRKCNTLHLEPLSQMIELPKNASHEAVVKAFKELGLEVIATKAKSKTVKPKAVRKAKEKSVEAVKDKKPKPKTEKPKAEVPKTEKKE